MYIIQNKWEPLSNTTVTLYKDVSIEDFLILTPFTQKKLVCIAWNYTDTHIHTGIIKTCMYYYWTDFLWKREYNTWFDKRVYKLDYTRIKDNHIDLRKLGLCLFDRIFFVYMYVYRSEYM